MKEIFENQLNQNPETPYPAPVYGGIKVMLASASPRRRELLAMVLPSFEIISGRDVNESYPDDLRPEEVPVYLSQLKARAYSDILADNKLLITADTVVICDGEVLGKPHSAKGAEDMLRQLSGKTHTVVTGVTLSSLAGKRHDSFSETTQVTFDNLTEEEIRLYVERFKPFDKAGSYGIQEWIGAVAISGIRGCFYNVMGLPLHALYIHLRNFF